MLVRIFPAWCLIIVLLFSAKAFGANELSTLPDYLSHQHFAELKEQTNEAKKQNNELKKTLSLLEALPKNLAPNSEITQETLGKTKLLIEQTQQEIAQLMQRSEQMGKTLEDNAKRNTALYAALQKLSNPLVGADADFQQHNLERTQTLLDLNEQYAELLHQYRSAILETVTLKQQYKALSEQRYQRENERYLELQKNADASHHDPELYHIEQLEKQRTHLMQNLTPAHVNRASYLDDNIELLLITNQISLEYDLIQLNQQEQRLQELQFADFSNISMEHLTDLQQELSIINQNRKQLEEQVKNTFLSHSERFALYIRQRPEVPSAILDRQKNISDLYQRSLTAIENDQLLLSLISRHLDRQYTLLSQNHLKENYILEHVQLSHLPTLSNQILNSFRAFVGQYAVAAQVTLQFINHLPQEKWLLLISAFLTFILVSIFSVRFLNKILSKYNNDSRPAFAKRVIIFAISMIKYNIPNLVLLLLTLTLIKITNLPMPSSGLVILIPAVILTVSIPHFATKILVRSQFIKTPEDANLVRPITQIALVSSILFSLVMMANWVLPENDEVNLVLRWLFGIYILMVSYPIFLIVRRTLNYMDEYYNDYYVYHVIRFLCLLIPIITTLFGLSSLLGFINLAWLIAKHGTLFMLHGLIWVSILALGKDASLWAKRYALKNTSNGLFWAQDVINPLHTLLRYGSLIIISKKLIDLYQWNEKTPFIKDILTLLHAPIFGKEDSQFTASNILLMAFLIYLIFRIGGWVRSFTYRWIFSKIIDLGIRNSFSVFSQYAVVTIGFLLALRLIGIDLTAFTVFAGALGVGIGFGMQNIANNFISGILLLIERPLRNGDIITVGNYEGTVERIGMRSLTITTFNNESVILPNSDFITSAFMNWSHRDQIVRTILYLDLAYKHDPVLVHRAFSEALQDLVKKGYVMDADDVRFGIYAYNCSERGVTYRVQYFMNMAVHRLHDVRHLVVTALWHACRNHHFEIAYPKQETFFPEFEQFPKLLQHTPPDANTNLQG
ncbi:MAG: mechanosensitive ion channel [Cardiobacteriaceae bacterium]|nr:mechanosensitive ion channel [Cardiobacteriaceae bacterium]